MRDLQHALQALQRLRAEAQGGEVEHYVLAVEQAQPNLTVRGYAPWPRLAGGPEAPYAPALEALSVGLAMARDPVVADVVHTHTWYVGLGGMLVQSIHDVPLVVTLHSMEPLRPWKADQLGTGYAV